MKKLPQNRTTFNRLSINVVNFLVTCMVLFLAFRVSDSGFATKINAIKENLDKAMFQIMDSAKANYSEFNSSVTYAAKDIGFHPKGMDGLYNLTNLFMKGILGENVNASKIITVEQNSINLRRGHEVEFLLSLAGVLTVLVVLLLFLVFLPFCGLCFCCCRCCGYCGARPQPCDKKRDLCKKLLQGTMLIVFTTLLLFCVVCCFASNQQLKEGVDDLIKNARISVDDSSKYLDNTNRELRHLLIENYGEFETVLVSTINSSGQIVMGQLEEMSNATAMTTLHTIVFTNLPAINTSFTQIKADTNQLRIYASQLNDAVRKLKKDLIATLAQCVQHNVQQCSDMQETINRLQTTIDFNKLPDVSSDIEDFEKTVKLGDLQKAAQSGMNELHDLQNNINKTLSDSLRSASEQISKAGETIHDNLNDVSRSIKDIQTKILNKSKPVLDQSDDYIKQYNIFVYYVGIGVGCVLLLIVICVTFGMICGVCGKPPDGYSDNCCNKGSGGQFLICAVMIIFFCGVILVVVTIVAFLLGLFSQRLVCYPLRNPYNSDVLNLVDQSLILRNVGVNVSVAKLISNCHKNHSAYEVFNLQSKFDLQKTISSFDIDRYLDKLNTSSVLQGKNIKILKPEFETVFNNLARFSPDIDFDKYSDELRSNFTNYSLDLLQDQLKDLIRILSDMSHMEEIRRNLELSLMHINAYNEKLVIPMKNLADSVVNTSKQLNEYLHMNYSTFPYAIGNLTEEIKHAEYIINTEGVAKLNNITSDFKRNVKDQINAYTNRTVFYMERKVGQCGPLSAVINATLTATCDRILTPLNGFWFSLLCSLMLFFPIIIVSVKLASLYQKYKSYGQYVETEYLYDAYADRDSIPLNSRHSKRAKKNTKKPKRYEDRPTVGCELVPREYPGSSHPPDTRYADMAPKQWEEFPNGGPPHYQRAPTEYERPPPYYYPNSGEQQSQQP